MFKINPLLQNPVFRIAVATTLLVASFAMYAPVIAVLLQQRGYSTVVIGTFAMIGFACIGVLMPVLPSLCARFGEITVYRVGAAGWLLAGVGYAASDTLAMWSLAAVVGGIGSAAVWNATESLIARHSPSELRGRITGLYQTALGAALAVGPFVPALSGLDAKQTLYAACAIQALALALVLHLRRVPVLAATPAKSNPEPAMSTWRALQHVPGLALIAFVGGVFESGLSSISAAHAAGLGMSLSAAASVVGALGVGSFLLQYPAGLLADQVKPGQLFGCAGVALLGSSLAVGWGHAIPWIMWVCAFIWGGVGGALYTLTMIRVAHQFMGHNTAAGTAAMITGYTLGGAVGPVVGGAALQFGNAPGLAVWLSALSLLVIVLAVRWRAPKIP